LKDLSFSTLLLRLFEISRRFNMTVQPQLILLQKTLLNVEGLGRELYPELDVWSTASPILREWMRERSSPRRLWRIFREQLPELIELARVLPTLVKGALERVRAGKLRLHLDAAALERLAAWLDAHYRPR
jgi:ubiquinone biosynthesis protein